MIQSVANVMTQNSSKYLQQLSKHWAHKFEKLTYDEKYARIPFSPDVLMELYASEKQLTVHVVTPDEELLQRYEEVLVSHLERFAFREPLEISWERKIISSLPAS